jgi:hypothetical protein
MSRYDILSGSLILFGLTVISLYALYRLLWPVPVELMTFEEEADAYGDWPNVEGR